MQSLNRIYQSCMAGCWVILVLALAGSADAAGRAPAASTPVRVNVGFAQVDTGKQADVEGNEVFIAASYSAELTEPLLAIDDVTGRSQVVPVPAGCYTQLFTPRGVMYGCPTGPPDLTQFELGGLGGGPLTSLTVSGFPLGLGTAWVEVQNKAPEEHTPVTYSFDNIATGAVRPNPLRPGGSVSVSLDSPGLTVPICRPIHIPRAWDPDVGGWVAGGLIQLGRFALASGTYPDTAPYYAAELEQLEQCGQRQKLTVDKVGAAIGASPQLLVWQSSRGWLSGVMLPSERRFNIRLPAKMRNLGLDPEVGVKHLYVNDTSGSEAVWRTSLKPILAQVDRR